MESFFYLARRSAPEIIDTLGSRYSWTIRDIEAVPVVDLAEVLKKAEEQTTRAEIFAEWAALQPFMIMKWLKFMPFEEYHDYRTGGNIDTRPASEILAEAEEIKKYTGVNNGSV